MRGTSFLQRAIPLGMRSVAWVTEQAGTGFKLRPIWLDEVRDDELLIEMKYSGICHTDIAVSQGMLGLTQFPAIFGHEGAGIIRAIGEKVRNKNLAVGDSVVLSYSTCNDCPACNSGKRYFCHSHPEVNHNGVRLSDRTTPARLEDNTPVRSQYFGHSSFAKHSVVHEDTVVKCDHPDLLQTYAPLGCGFQTGAGAVFNVLKTRYDETVAIFGLGAVGLAALMASKYLGVRRLIAVDLNPSRLELAASLGATDLINTGTVADIPATIKDLTDGGVDQAIECSGSSRVVETCAASIGCEGQVVALGVPKPGSAVSLDPLDFLLGNKVYRGIIQGASEPSAFLPFLMDLHRRGHFPVEKACTQYSANHIMQAIDDMKQGRIIKPVLSWDEVNV